MKDRQPIYRALPDSGAESVRLEGSFSRKKRGFAAFLICCALLVAAFAVTALWHKGGGRDWFESKEPIAESQPPSTEEATQKENETPESLLSLPEGAVPILSMDLSYDSYGKEYLNSEIAYTPDFDMLLSHNTGSAEPTNEPLVLIIHTHTSESYLSSDLPYVQGAIGDLSYSQDARQNVLSVGKVLCETLNENGIAAIHCTIFHDAQGLSGSYQRSAETVKRYLEQYPTIRYVIDLHRDSVTASNGSPVRSEGKHGEEATAQVMAVVGSDRNGTEYANGWEGNLALALQLREKLNASGDTVARPVMLRRSSYNQELAEYSLLLEIGTAANSPEEAKRAAVLVGNALSDLIYAR